MKRYIKSAVKNILEESLSDRQLIASDPSTDIDTLRQLANDNSILVKRELLANPSCPIDILYQYADTQDVSLQEGLAQNPNLPDGIFRKLAVNPKWEMMCYLARNPSTPADILDSLYDKAPYYWVKKDLSSNPNASSRIKQDYADYLKSVDEIKETVRDYVKDNLYNRILGVIRELEDDEFECSTVAELVEGYDTDWCAGEYSEEAEELWNKALDALVDYEVYMLFEESNI